MYLFLVVSLKLNVLSKHILHHLQNTASRRRPCTGEKLVLIYDQMRPQNSCSQTF